MAKENVKPKGAKKFNYVDVILLIVILVIVGVIVYTSVAPITKQILYESYDVEYTLQIRGVRREFNNKIREGDRVVETETLKEIGTVTSAVYSPSKFVGTASDGRTVTSDYPGMYDVTITVRAKAETPSGMYEINSVPVTAGKTIPFRVPDYIGEAVCVSISEVSE